MVSALRLGILLWPSQYLNAINKLYILSFYFRILYLPLLVYVYVSHSLQLSMLIRTDTGSRTGWQGPLALADHTFRAGIVEVKEINMLNGSMRISTRLRVSRANAQNPSELQSGEFGAANVILLRVPASE